MRRSQPRVGGFRERVAPAGKGRHTARETFPAAAVRTFSLYPLFDGYTLGPLAARRRRGGLVDPFELPLAEQDDALEDLAAEGAGLVPVEARLLEDLRKEAARLPRRPVSGHGPPSHREPPATVPRPAPLPGGAGTPACAGAGCSGADS